MEQNPTLPRGWVVAFVVAGGVFFWWLGDEGGWGWTLLGWVCMYYAYKLYSDDDEPAPKQSSQQQHTHQQRSYHYQSHQSHQYHNQAHAPPPQQSHSDKELRELYRQLARKYHPDFAKSPEERAMRDDLMKKINVAYQQKDIATLKIFQ